MCGFLFWFFGNVCLFLCLPWIQKWHSKVQKPFLPPQWKSDRTMTEELGWLPLSSSVTQRAQTQSSRAQSSFLREDCVLLQFLLLTVSWLGDAPSPQGGGVCGPARDSPQPGWHSLSLLIPSLSLPDSKRVSKSLFGIYCFWVSKGKGSHHRGREMIVECPSPRLKTLKSGLFPIWPAVSVTGNIPQALPSQETMGLFPISPQHQMNGQWSDGIAFPANTRCWQEMHKTQGYFEENRTQMSIRPKKLGFSILIRDNIDVKAKSTIRDKKGYHIMIKRTIQHEAITILDNT